MNSSADILKQFYYNFKSVTIVIPLNIGLIDNSMIYDCPLEGK